jgi:hypothetical protein
MVVLILENSAVDIKRKINSMIYLNVLSYSVLSGCGNVSMLRSAENDDINDLLVDIPTGQRPFNIFITKSLYKKGLPQYVQVVDNPYDFSSYKWVNDKQKKQIEIDVMASSIIASCNLIERILTFDLELENPDFVVYILFKTAMKQAKFILKYQKVGNKYYNVEDLSAGPEDREHIEITSNNPKPHTQFAVMHAFSSLAQLGSYNIRYLNYDNYDISAELDSLPKLLVSFMEQIDHYSTKELSLIGLHLTDMQINSQYCKDAITKALKMLAKELCNRVNHEGGLADTRRSDIDTIDTTEESTSPFTLISSLNLLSQLTYILSSKSCNEASHKLYKQLSPSWDKEGKIFRLKDSNKQSYKIKLIAAIIGALYSFSKIEHPHEKSLEINIQIAYFVETALVKSRIFNGQCYPILQSSKVEAVNDVDSEIPWAPVFNKAFEYKISKRKFYSEADVFRADDIMPACVVMLTSINN